MGKEKIESYYKILGTTAKISNRRIKEKYIEAVKKHPPETDPEGFEKVRRAYETLKDPEKRKQYDLTRKYGTNIEEIMDKAFIAIERMDYAKASKLLEQASKIMPDNQSIMIGQMMVAIMTDELEKGEALFKKVLPISTDPDEIVALYTLKARMLHENDYSDEAIETLEKGKEQFPNQASQFNIPISSIYMGMELYDEAWKTINSNIPAPEEETFEDIYTFLTWANIMIGAEKWESSSKIQSRFRKFLKKLTDVEEIEEAKELLTDHFEDSFEEGDFLTAEFCGDLLKVMPNGLDKEMQQNLNQAKKTAHLQKQLGRLQRDEAMFPLIYIHALEWFFTDYMPEEEELSMMLNSLPQDMIEELKEEKEEYAVGIVRLQKKYPLLYKAYKEKWDNLFSELTKGFNREMRRELRRVK